MLSLVKCSYSTVQKLIYSLYSDSTDGVVHEVPEIQVTLLAAIMASEW
jgi:hypothetical protein